MHFSILIRNCSETIKYYFYSICSTDVVPFCYLTKWLVVLEISYGSGFVDVSSLCSVQWGQLYQISLNLFKGNNVAEIWEYFDNIPCTHNLLDDPLNVGVKFCLNKKLDPIIISNHYTEQKADLGDARAGDSSSMQLNSSKLTLQEACSCRQDVLKRQSRCTKDKRENDVLRRTKASRDCMYPDDRCVWEGTPWRGEDGSSRRWCLRMWALYLFRA